MLNLILLIFIAAPFCRAQFTDHFDKKEIDGWFFFTGDGAAEMDFIQMDGYARISIDATKDKYNVYWTLIKRDVTAFLDLNKFKNPSFQLRVEAKVRVHDAPRRLNMMVNTQRTTNFHIDLMEFDIPDTTGWHTISMTTKKFDALPGDTVYVQLCATDYGTGKYSIDVDYYLADIVDINQAGPDKGELVPYHPPVPDISTFSNHLNAAQDGLINADFPDVNFNDWHSEEPQGAARIVTVNENQWILLRWDFEPYQNQKINGSGLLELTTHSVFKGGDYRSAFGEDFGMEFGKIRVFEIKGGDPEWSQDKVTYNNFLQGKSYDDVVNSQMVIDIEPADKRGSTTLITISKPVLQRLVDGKTRGLLIRPLGAINASFYALESKMENTAPKLHFNTAK
ncbi:MAG: hypothetical protein EH224_07980 [Calditrichaeota bacterium]|nr:MAG: hypothetical protein EH224_07980 [Calditrichota bacterium]